jgi:hypothetical protein
MGISEKHASSHDETVARILRGAQWLTAAQIGRQPAELETWVRDGNLFAIESADAPLRFPAYAFDRAFCPLPGMAAVLTVLNMKDPWQIAAWFESTSSFLGGRRPREVIACDPLRVHAAALDRNQPV